MNSVLFHVWCCFLTSAAIEQVLPPENVRLGWADLYQELSWTPPKHSMQDCHFQIYSTVREEGVELTSEYKPLSSPWNEFRIIHGGFLQISIRTVCGGRMSEAVVVGIDDPDFELSCVILSSARTHCSWKPPASARLSFFYNLEVGDSFDKLRECPSYNGTTGCDLQMIPLQQINVLLNGTLGNRTIRNVYEFVALNVSLPPLVWAVEESKEHFLINWTDPEFSNLAWRYVLNYTACDKSSSLEMPERPFKLQRDAECPYRISMRGETEYYGGTEWTPDRHFGKASGPNPLLFAVVLIPLVLALLVVLTLLCCLKNKDKIFPKVPQPNAELLKDLMTNNNKINLPNFYSTKAEEECPVTLVVDPKQPQL